jgi:hypothetical protein
MLAHCAGFKTNAFYWVLKSCETVGDVLDFAWQLSLEVNLGLEFWMMLLPFRHI